MHECNLYYRVIKIQENLIHGKGKELFDGNGDTRAQFSLVEV